MSNYPPGVTGNESTFWLRDPTDAEIIASNVSELHRTYMISPTCAHCFHPVAPDLAAFAQALEAEYGFTIPVEDFGNLLRREEAIDYVMERMKEKTNAPSS